MNVKRNPGDSIGYIRKEIPKFDVAVGDRYEGLVPDTLNLAERATLALNALTESVDAEHYWEHYLSGHFDQNPPYINYSWEGPCLPKPIQAIPMMRIMSGSTQNPGVEVKMLENLLRDIEEDGLWWQKIEGRPWRSETFKTDQVWPCVQGRFMEALMQWYALDRDERLLKVVANMVRGLGRIALRNEDRAWFHTVYTRKGWQGDETPSVLLTGQADVPTPSEPEGEPYYNIGLPLRGLVSWCRISGDSAALDLADRLARFFLKPTMWGADGPSMVVHHEHGHRLGHFHTMTMGVMGLLDYALFRNDSRLIRFCADFYEWMRNFGISRIGFFPAVLDSLEGVRKSSMSYGGGKGQCSETCAIADMLWLAVKLSDSGVGDYWEDVDQYIRNGLVEHQILRCDLVEELIAVGPKHILGPYDVSSERIVDRMMGTFSSGGDPTMLYDWFTQCCLGNGAVGLYMAWEAIVRESGGVAQVNLLLNCASPWLDVDSYLPYEGKVVLKNKTARKIHLRVPLWSDKQAVRCRVNGNDAQLGWLGRYLILDGVKPGDQVVIEFPMIQTTERWTELVYETTYTCQFKGNTLVDISPRADRLAYTKMSSDDGDIFEVKKGYPMYQREQYKQNQAPMRTIKRFVAKKIT